MKKPIYLLIILSLSISQHILGFTKDEILFEKIDNRDGLSSDLVNEIYQDDNGFIWIATEDGLNCYTGTEFIVYRHSKNDPNSISSSDTKSVCSTPDGKIWIATRNKGINILDPYTKEIKRYDSTTDEIRLVDDKVYNIFCDSKGRVWITTPKGITVYSTNEKSTLSIITDKKSAPSTVYEDSQGNILIGSWKRTLYHFNEQDNTLEIVPFNVTTDSDSPIKSICEDSRGNLWIGMWGDGLYKTHLEDGKLHIHDHIEIKNSNFSSDNMFNLVYDIVEDMNGIIWLGTDAGLGRILDTKNDKIVVDWTPTGSSKNAFKSKDAAKLFIDAANNIWIGTQGNGISKIDFNQSRFKTYVSRTDAKEYSSDIFRSFWYYNDELYVGVNALGFGKYNLKEGKVTPFKSLAEFKNLSKRFGNINAIVSCHEVDDRFLWMATRYQGVILFDKITKEARKIYLPVFLNEKAFHFVEKDRIWIGTSSGLVVYYKDSTSKNSFPYRKTKYQHIEGDDEGLYDNKISHILRDKDGTLWISYSNGGIDKVIEDAEDPRKLHFERATENNEQLPSTTLMFEDSKGHIWLGTESEGLWLFVKDEKRLINFSKTTAFKGNSIYSILEDDQKRLWLSTNLGLSSISILNLGVPYVINYSVEDGLQGNIFCLKSSLKDKDGNLCFGGYYGFNYFNPKNIKHNRFVPPLAITHLKVDHEDKNINYPDGEELIISHKSNSFQINFEALSYTKSINNQFHYKLEGVDKEWIKTKNGLNKAIYGKLPAGQYIFSVRGSNNNGVWNITPLTLKIKVKQSPFKSYVAYVIYALLLVLGIALYLAYTKRNYRLEQAIKDEQDERLRAEKINQFKLKFFTNISHELLTPLSIISNGLEQHIDNKPNEGKNLAIVQRNANRLTRLINQILNFRKVEGSSRKLTVEPCEFNYLISSLRDNFLPLCEKNNVKFEVNGNIEEEIYLDVDKIEKMLHNILSNAFKHTPIDGQIILEYRKITKGEDVHLEVKVSDSGKGIAEEQLNNIFDRFYRIDDSKYESGAGIGLAFTRSLVNLHKGRIKAENCANGGACFTFNVPISEWVYNEDEKIHESKEREIEYSFADEMDEIKVPLRTTRESDKELPKILIVEDNLDMRTIMRNYLSKYFEVYESENGLQGLETLSKVDIELIISDIMMPEMDGLTFCRKVKVNITTSHIPVILTTAKRTEENFIEGYEAQADSYITKPVNLQLLLVRIINLLNQRAKLRDIFAGDKKVDVKKLSINNLDQQLFEKLNKYIDENMYNSNLTIGMLSEHVNISSSVFYRKIKAFSAMSPNEYLRSKRLNKAAELLKTGMSPSVVTYECGFSDPSYFGVCFKKQYGVPPKKFVESL